MLSDMRAFVAILNDYDVAKNLQQVPHPFTDAQFREALAHRDQERRDGAGYDFAVTRAMDGALIGMCSAERGPNGLWEFGYWYGRPYWGQGYATEAAHPVLRFAFEHIGVEELAAGWFFDNPASGHVLSKLGFIPTGVAQRDCIARGCMVASNQVRLTRAQFARKKAA